MIGKLRKVLVLLLCLVFLFPSGSACAENCLMMPVTLTVYVGDSASAVRAYNANYKNNLFLSLADLSCALDGTAAQFSISYANTQQDGEFHSIRRGEPWIAENSGITQIAFDEREDVWLVFQRNRIFLDGQDRKYYTCREGGYDLYMSLTDIQLMLNIRIDKMSGQAVRIDPNAVFVPDFERMNAEGVFEPIRSFVLGDADTGSILYAQNARQPVPIASTTKLMTYLLTVEAIRNGTLQADGTVTVSARAAEVSQSADGMIHMEEGNTVTVPELISAMLVGSSNESAVALAECVSGTEEQFVERMNERAAELGLCSALFFTPDGLPVYTDSGIPAKQQNLMSAQDLFLLSSYLLDNYPEITAVTSQTYAGIPSFSYATANSNPLVFNMPGVDGLKTGSTNRAGYCLVASMPLTVGNQTHHLVLVMLGAENGAERGQAAELLMRCAAIEYMKSGF